MSLYAVGCSGVCDDAKELCQQCELSTSNCDRFDDLSSEDCEEAVTTYENNCPGQE